MKPEKALLPIGIQTFSTMIEENFVYVDKTKYIHNLIKKGRYYFLSRPRRFGKSLLVSTLEEIFAGNRKLFENLFIDSTDYDWAKHPVILLSLSALSAETGEALKLDLTWTLTNIAKRYALDISDAPSLQTKFRSLIEQLGVKNKVVVLVDEYDYPILTNINNLELADECREILRDFFPVLKDTDKYLRFVFVTGITKFSKTSIFSGLNNLNDLSLEEDASQLLGYTLDEINHAFKPYLSTITGKTGQSLEQLFDDLRFWYNGYQFAKPLIDEENTSHKVYNPFSVMLYLSRAEFLNFWFDTGTPSFLMHLMKKQQFPISQLEGSEVNVDETKSYEISKIKLIPLLWQTGYLTIDTYNPLTKNYRLKFPNNEVKVSFLQNFVSYLTDADIALFSSLVVQLAQAIKDADLRRFFETMEVFFAQIPYTMQLPLEKYYQSIFYVVMKLIGAHIKAEVTTNNGRIDALLETSSHIFVFEFKLDESAEVALAQIEAKKYYQKYLHQNKVIMLTGVKFNTQKRNIEQWLVKEVVA